MPFISEDRRETNRISGRKNKYRGNVLKEFVWRSGISTMSEFTVRKFGSSPHLPREEEEGQGGQYIRRAPLVTYLSDPS